MLTKEELFRTRREGSVSPAVPVGQSLDTKYSHGSCWSRWGQFCGALLTILNSPAKDKPRVTGAFDQMSNDSRFEFRRTDWRRSKTGSRRAHQEAAEFLQNLGPAKVVAVGVERLRASDQQSGDDGEWGKRGNQAYGFSCLVAGTKFLWFWCGIRERGLRNLFC